MIRVMSQGRAAVILVNGVVLRIDQNTTLIFNGVEEEKTSLIDVLKGVVNFFSRWPRSLKVTTPFVNGNVRGTEFLVEVDSEKTVFSVFEGQVDMANNAGSLTLGSGQSAKAEAQKAPVPHIIVLPRDAVQWALYYPALIYDCPEGMHSAGPQYAICRASSLLHAGRVHEARAEIEKVFKKDPNNSQAFALESIIAVTQNQKDKARILAEKSVLAAPDSASGLIALSYAQQAQFDIEGALNSLRKAAEVDPNNSIAWARLSEMWLSSGDLNEALKTAERAVELNPSVSLTRSVLGFAYLAKVKIGKSKETFEKAVELDQAAPLPRLGLGLAKIREGDLEEGRREIEIAVSLDPDNSLIRSYLGKAYYEEKRDKFARDQYRMAKEFDPKDPTPFFYDAIRKQSINRPVEALHDMQQAIELNDDRAVYRSKLLLDSDLAARSAGLARIYSDLGFEQLALVEGWKSVNADPSDYSGHRFLADTYASLPRHEIARVSELLQSQLLQPINITPVQPSLAESSLFILDGAGPADLSYNEFNPLFNRDRYSLQISGIAGENSTFGEEIVVAAVQGKASISAGQFHYETDGWRENNDQKQDIYNFFVQVELSPQTSVQTEFRAKDFDRGDLTLLFGKDNFIPTLRQNNEERTIRFGFRHGFSAGSVFLGSFIYKNTDISSHLTPDSPFLKALNIETEDEEGYSAEMQHLLNSQYVKFASGIGYFDKNREDVATMDIVVPDGPPFPIQVTSVENLNTYHTNMYVYSYINYPENVTFTVGGSADFYDGQDKDTDQFNPKFGVTYKPFPATTLRAAAFRTLKRTLSTNQTLEPTQVAGFNQFYDDDDATEAWRYGIAIDQKFSESFYAGAEYSQRDLEFPSIVIDPEATTRIKHFDSKERLGRAYLYWTPHKWIALSAEYQYEKIEIDKEYTAYFEFVRTNSFPIMLTFSHPSGVSADLQTTYIDQEGKFKPQNLPTGVVVSGTDNFWITDASVSYRLPKRFGILKIGVKNLFDESFNYQDTDLVSPLFQPERMVFARFTLSF
jgi:tetratricopeptide (TPR) repeat protein